MLLLPALTSLAEATPHMAQSVVLGANVTLRLGPDVVHRVGAGIDVGYEYQGYNGYGERLDDGRYVIWAQEGPNVNGGPVVHLWRVEDAWSVAVGGRLGVTWPLRVGYSDGWWPGPGVALELAPLFSTAGYGGMDGAVVADLPWVRARLASTLTLDGLVAKRVHLGAFVPLKQPRQSDDPNYLWDIDDAR